MTQAGWLAGWLTGWLAGWLWLLAAAGWRLVQPARQPSQLMELS